MIKIIGHSSHCISDSEWLTSNYCYYYFACSNVPDNNVLHFIMIMIASYLLILKMKTILILLVFYLNIIETYHFYQHVCLILFGFNSPCNSVLYCFQRVLGRPRLAVCVVCLFFRYFTLELSFMLQP